MSATVKVAQREAADKCFTYSEKSQPSVRCSEDYGRCSGSRWSAGKAFGQTAILTYKAPILGEQLYGHPHLAEGWFVVQSRAAVSMSASANFKIEGAVDPGKEEKVASFSTCCQL